MTWKDFLFKALGFVGVLTFVLLIGLMVGDGVISSATGETYTEEKFRVAEQYHCAKQGLELVEYIGQSCSLFGCHDVEKSKCVGSNIEKKLDYNDKIFCQYTVKGDMGLC